MRIKFKTCKFKIKDTKLKSNKKQQNLLFIKAK